MIRLGIDAGRFAVDRRGMGRYARRLLDLFEHAFADQVACTLIIPEWPAWASALRYRTVVDGRFHRLRSRRDVDRGGLDLLWFPFNGPDWEGFRLPSIATLHDASPFVIADRAEERQRSFRLAAQRCTRILTDSRFSAHELQRNLPIASDRLDVVPLGVAAPLPLAPVPPEVAALGRFVLFVGEPEPRKNTHLLAQAVANLRSRIADLRFVIAGFVPEWTPVPADATMLGYVDDATLAALYRACAVFAFPSRYEGFGLPLLEAMSYDAPVVASDAASLPEAGGDAALYVPPDDLAALEAALYRVLTDPQLADDLRARGRRRAATMTWHACAAATLDVFRRACR